jgi:hypothetical protein
MGPEQWIRGTLDRAANLITGQSLAVRTTREGELTSTSLAGAAAKVGDRLAGTALGEGLANMGLEMAYTPDQLVKFRQLVTVLGQRNDFKAMVYKDLMFLRPYEPGIGRIEKWLENYAKFGARMQDPTWGMRADTLARRYLEGALQEINATPTLNVISNETLIAALATDPEWLKDNMEAAHNAGTRAVAQLRSLKPTVLSQTLRGIYEPLSASPNAGLNFLGNVVLKMPMLFSNYGMNVITTVTGLQGLDQMTAAFMTGRTNGFKHPRTLLGRVQAKMAGREITPDDDANFDLDSVIETIDLSRAFIRGGLTHTGLFAFGLAAGGLGLSGEDDETKKRRKLAALQGAGFVYDPRDVQNDFRNKDAIFLDWLPFGMDSWFRVTGEDVPGGARSMAQLNWTLKQFISPIIGMEKFFETGDFRNVTWGFEDAIGSFPLINTLMWDDAVQTAHEFAQMANDEAKLGGPQNMPIAAAFAANAVGTYERMLFENSFINQIYPARDRYDRDPYVLPLRDSSGALQRDIEGNPRKQDLAFESFIDPETGELKSGYLNRDIDSATLHALTENRATLATVATLFSGLSGNTPDYFRTQMPIKERVIERPPVSQAEAETLIRKISQDTSGGQPNLTADEISSIMKANGRKAGVFLDYNKVDAQAAAFAKQEGPAAMSVLDAQGRELLTKEGAHGVLRGLAKMSVHLGDASLRGIHIPFKMREEIQKDWMRELIQDGVDMGLDQTKATSRMKRLWYGPISNPSVQGLGDILWSKDISYTDKIKYNQLNTTYVMGPDGRPWATGFTRDGLLGALGVKPLKRAMISEQGATGNDSILNTVDFVNNINTGMRGLELIDESRNVPTDVEIGKSIEQAIKDAASSDFTPFQPFTNRGGGGFGFTPFRHFGRSGFRRFGRGGGGGGFSSFPNFSKMFALPNVREPFGNDIPFINTTNPLIRRGDVRRERVWSERGRLKQWQ